jgi:hypothetical protein
VIVFAGFWPTQLKLTGGTQSLTLSLEPAPTPTPTPLNALPQSFAPIPAPLLARTIYTVEYNTTFGGNNCMPQTSATVVGSFTTK